ncbi:LPXTG cell wall anchor domain-containing protein [Bacillus sp. UNC41MFS5]|nr:LPXTG cell wall anchor domain-containing protein [Bacillus sp. UNC41MFS5]
MSRWGKTIAGAAIIGLGIGFLFRKRKGGDGA